MATHTSTLAWEIPWTAEPGRLQSMGSLRIRQDWAASLSLFTFMHWRRKWQPTPVFLPGEFQGREPGGLPSMGLHSRTWLTWLSSSSSIRLWDSVHFFLQSLPLLLFRLGKFYWSVSSLDILSLVISMLLLNPSKELWASVTESFSSLICAYFFITLFFAKIFLFFFSICFKRIYSCLWKHVYDSCFKIFVQNFNIWIIFVFTLIDCLFSFMLQPGRIVQSAPK